MSEGVSFDDAEVDRILAMSDEEMIAQATPLDLAEADRLRRNINRLCRAYDAGKSAGRVFTSADVEAAARASDPKAWAWHDADALRREEYDRDIKHAWHGTPFEVWRDSTVQDSLDKTRAALRAVGTLEEDEDHG